MHSCLLATFDCEVAIARIFKNKGSGTASATSNRASLCLYQSLSGSKCSVGVHLPKGWHQLLTRRHWAWSGSGFRQGLTGVGIGHTRLNDNLPSRLLHARSLPFSKRYTVPLSGPWLSSCSDDYRITRRIAVIQNAELRHMPEWHLNLNYDANYHWVLMP